jgi:hypothetical protein
MTAKAVAEKENTDIMLLDDSMFEQDAGGGLEGISSDDLALPFLKVLSRQDPILDELDDAKAGDIYNTVTGKVYKGKEGIRVIPCAYQKRFIEWAPRGTGNGAPINIYNTSSDCPKTERSQEDNKEYVIGGNGSYIEATAQHYVIVLDDQDGPTTALIAMKSTQLKKSRKWNSMVMSRSFVGKNGPYTPASYSHIYKLSTLSEENSKGSWHGWEIALDEKMSDAGLYQLAKDFAQSVDRGEVQAKHTDDSGETVAGGVVEDAPF